MDVFSAAVTACDIIYKTLEGSAAFSKESRGLAARFRYDAHILRHFCKHFESSIGAENGLDPNDQAILEESAGYLGDLLGRVETVKAKLTAGSRLSKELTRITWAFRRNDLKELERELYEWTRRLDLRLVALPERARTVMSLENETEENVKNFTPRLAARIRLERYAAKSAEEKKLVWEKLALPEESKKLIKQANPEEDFDDNGEPFALATFEGKRVVQELRQVPSPVQDNAAWSKAQATVGEFAAALNCLDSTVSGLLRCRGFISDSFDPDGDWPTFRVIYALPSNSRGGKLTSFKDILKTRDPNGRRPRLRHTLNQRLEFARKLATAVFFVHSIGWVHKAIRSDNVLLLGQDSTSTPGAVSWSLTSPYLVGFGIARSNEDDSFPGSRGAQRVQERIYLHPTLQGEIHRRSVMAHDVYSLGVVLLELGLWTPLEERAELRVEPGSLREALVKLANETEVLMGKRYREAVQRCFSNDSEDDAESTRVLSSVLGKLEDLAQAV